MDHLLLLHGALGHPDNLFPIERTLAAHFTIHKITFAGHGTSELPASGINIQLYVQQVVDYCEANKIERLHIFGYSMGGYVGLLYALAFPGRVASILTLATKLDWSPESAAKEARLLQPEVIAEKVPQFALQLARLHGDDKWKQLLPAVAALMMELGNKPLPGDGALAELSTNVQMMVGDKDNMVSIDETRAVVAKIPNARLVVLPGTVHPIEKLRMPLLISLMKDFWQLRSGKESTDR